MAIRKLPSGKYQASIRLPGSNQRTTKTFPLKRQAADWEADTISELRKGTYRDPRLGRTTVGDWFERWIATQVAVPSTRRRLESAWRTHCEPKWGRRAMDSISRLETRAWVKELETTPPARRSGVLSAASIENCVHLMSSLYKAAQEETPPIVVASPFAGLRKPRRPPPVVQFLEHDEALALVEAIDRLNPDQPQFRVLVEVGLWCGPREEELFGLFGDRVDWLRHTIQITRVATRDGVREYPKTKRSHRSVPVPADLVEAMAALMRGRDRDALVFTTAHGKPISDSNFRYRVWNPAVKAAGIRAFPPRIMRHTAASWLVMAGVDLYRVQELLGHEDIRTTQTYAHLAPDAHDVVRSAWLERGARMSHGSSAPLRMIAGNGA